MHTFGDATHRQQHPGLKARYRQVPVPFFGAAHCVSGVARVRLGRIVRDPLAHVAYVEVVERSSWARRNSTVLAAAAVMVDTMFAQHDLVHRRDLRKRNTKEADNSQGTASALALRLEVLKGTRRMAVGRKCKRLVTAGSYGCTYPSAVLHRVRSDVAVFAVLSGTQQQRKRDPFGILTCCTREHASAEEGLVACGGNVARGVVDAGSPRAGLEGDSRDPVPVNFAAWHPC